MNEHESEFDDPKLKRAVRRALGREAAPPSLRAKVVSLIAAEAGAAEAGAAEAGSGAAASAGAEPGEAGIGSSAPSVPSKGAHAGRRLVIDRNTWRLTAVAAGVLIALGFMAWQVRETFFPYSPYATGSGSYTTTIPKSVVLDLVKAHDRCAKLPDHHLIPGDNPEALRERLTVQGGVTASAVNLSAGWKFQGAGICKVGESHSAAHLLFVREDDYVSIFSMTAPAGCGGGMESYRETVEGHPVAGFARNGGLYCVVGSSTQGEFKMSELDPVLQEVEGSVAMGCLTHETIAATAGASANTQHH